MSCWTPASWIKIATSTSRRYAKVDANDILIPISAANRGGPERGAAPAADAVVSQHVVMGSGCGKTGLAPRDDGSI